LVVRLYKLEEGAKPIRVQTPFVVSTILVQTTLVVSSRVQVSERERDPPCGQS
jgi:hypothetical protein